MTQERLLRLLKTEPEKAMEVLTENYTGLVFKIIRCRIGAFLSESDIEEAVSDVFFDLYRSREKIDFEKGSLTSFIITLAQRRATDIFRKQKKSFFSEEPLEENTDAAATDVILQREERKLLLSAVTSLGEPDSLIIFRRYFLGEKYSEIGESLGLSENAVGKRLKKSLEKLSIIMEGDN